MFAGLLIGLGWALFIWGLFLIWRASTEPSPPVTLALRFSRLVGVTFFVLALIAVAVVYANEKWGAIAAVGAGLVLAYPASVLITRIGKAPR